MNFQLSEEQLMIQQAARDFAEKELLPGVIERDRKEEFPLGQLKKLGELGFMGMMVSPKYGGSGLDTVSYVLAMEELSKVDASTSVAVSVNNSLVCFNLEKYGTEQQKQKYLALLASGREHGAFCLSEPEAGSDAQNITTSVTDNGDHYEITGIKNWITNGGTAAVYIVFAQADASLGYKGISAFIVDANSQGVIHGPKEDKMGIRASDTRSIQFNKVKVPKENLLGEWGKGFRIALETLAGGRIGIAAQALGIASGAYERSLAYAQQRKTFGRPVSELQIIRFKLADIATKIESARLLCLKSAVLKDNKQDFNRASAIAKAYASQLAMDATTEAVQIHGGNGYVREYHVERMMRDAKVTQIYEGTTEIQKLVISRTILNN
jgi:alkylation response protein AidB-like acyl-CoA dehydrogenase